MTERLAVLVPSRGRPDNLHRLADALEETVVTPYRLWVRLDDDDPTHERYPAREGLVTVIGERVRFAASVNELAARAARDGATHLAILGDDVLPETPGWDTRLIAALHGRLGVAYGSDGLEHLHGPDLPTHVVVPVELYEKLGWVALPELRHLFCDNVWRELGRGLDNFAYLPDVKLTHLHPWAKKAPSDATYAEANDARHRSVDKETFEAWRAGRGYRDAMRALRA